MCISCNVNCHIILLSSYILFVFFIKYFISIFYLCAFLQFYSFYIFYHIISHVFYLFSTTSLFSINLPCYNEEYLITYYISSFLSINSPLSLIILHTFSRNSLHCSFPCAVSALGSIFSSFMKLSICPFQNSFGHP